MPDDMVLLDKLSEDAESEEPLVPSLAVAEVMSIVQSAQGLDSGSLHLKPSSIEYCL